MTKDELDKQIVEKKIAKLSYTAKYQLQTCFNAEGVSIILGISYKELLEANLVKQAAKYYNNTFNLLHMPGERESMYILTKFGKMVKAEIKPEQHYIGL